MIAIDSREGLLRLVQRSHAGDPEAQRRLVDAMEGTVRAAARRTVQDPHDAEDLAQSIFLAVFRGLAGFRGEAHFRTWLSVVARNEARRFLRTRQRRDDPVRDAERDPDRLEGRAGQGRREERRLRAALGRLPGSDREALERIVLEGLSYAEAARVLGCSPGAVRGRVYRARRELRRLLEESRG